VTDEIVDNVIATNYLAGDRLARRVAPAMVAQGWGRIVNVTTKLDTMNRLGTHPYGASKAALEMATEVWAKEVEGTGLTINIVNPGAGANTPGMAEEMRAMSRDGRAARLVEPEEMVPPLLYVVSREADRVNGMRFDANAWDAALPPGEAARQAGRRGSSCTRRSSPQRYGRPQPPYCGIGPMIGGSNSTALGDDTLGAASAENRAVNLAAMLLLASSVTAQLLAMPLHAPPQPARPQAAAGLAVSVTWIPALKLAAQLAPQSMPAGELVTLPPGLPITETESV
jgi:hypothetical protein